jgi:integrase
MGARYEPIEKSPGFYRHGKKVAFQYRDRRGRRRWASASTLKAAKLRKKTLEVDVARGEYRPTSRQQFTSYARSWCSTYQGRTSRRIKEATRRDYLVKLERYAIKFFGEMLLAEVEPQDVKEFARWVEQKGVKPDTVRLALAPVKALFATAFEEGLIRVNPAAGVRIAIPRDVVDDDQEGEVKALTEAQVVELLGKIPAGWRLFFQALLELGLRFGEVVELRWRDVEFGKGTVRIRRAFYDGDVGPPKSKYGRRTLQLTPELRGQLWRHRKAQRARGRAGEGELVFSTPARGVRLSGSNLAREVLKPAAVAAGLGELNAKGTPTSWVGFHTFRHTCATTLFRNGWNPKQVQLWLGHHSAAFTVDTYVHLLEDELPVPAFFGPILAKVPAPASSRSTSTISAVEA